MAKNIIVVLSIVVPVGNAASNVKQAMTLGVPVRDIINGTKLKLVEIERFQKMQRRQTEITAEKAVNADNEIQLRKLVAEEKSIDDAIERMSIGPLIKAGEFSSIQEGELNFDAAISQGSWVDKLNAALEKIPEQAGTVGRYAAITRDTALFQGLARSVQYGDFLAKSILYDHMTKTQKKTHEQHQQHRK